MKTLKKLRRRISYSDAFLNCLSIAGYWIFSLGRLLVKTRVDYHPEFSSIRGTSVIYVFWHGRLFFLPATFRGWNAVIMVDESWAGEILGRILMKFGFGIVRGSSTRKGVSALLAMRDTIVRDGMSGAFAGDGPKGPRHRVKKGIAYLACRLQCPVVPLTASSSSAWVLRKTWDRFLIPKPFSRCTVRFGRPIHVTSVEAGRNHIEEILLEMTGTLDEELRKQQRIPPSSR
jgi:hypothetical protein